jgi:transposase InsO family protein
VLLDPQWIDISPREIYYKILDEKKKILASPATFYRIAKKNSLLTKRVKSGSKNPLNREEPHLVATGSNQVWSWDVSQIKSSARNVRFYLYVIMDIWSRLVIAWRLEENEESDKAIELWKMAIEGQSISGKNLTNHKDNGSIMRSKEMIKFVKDVGMIDSYSRAGVSNDNPFSESLFRTTKYFREFPEFFDGLLKGREYFQNYYEEYNFTHRHSGIQFITPGERHYGEETKIMDQRNEIIDNFRVKNPHRYSSRAKVFRPIIEVKIN